MEGGSLKLNISATTDRATVVNVRFIQIIQKYEKLIIGNKNEHFKFSDHLYFTLKISNHVYFNLAGHGSGWEGLSQHKLQVFDDVIL